MIVRLYIDSERLDLFGDENIEVKSSIADVEDISKNTTDFSKDFTVSASKNNNKIFKHYYNANIDNTFDARTKVDGRIELSGVPYKIGKWTLRKVIVKNGKPSSYVINFVGNLISLKDKVRKDELKDLDLRVYDHEYNSTNVKQGLQSSLFSGDMIYTLFSKRQYYYNSDSNDTTDTDELTNIAYNTATGTNGVKFNELVPSLKLIKIIEAIETDYDITFSRDFFGRAYFNKMFLWLNRTSDAIGGRTQIVDFDSGDSTNVNFINNTGTFYAQASSASNDNIYWSLKLTIIPSAGYENVPYQYSIEVDGENGAEVDGLGTQVFQDDLSVVGERTFEVRYRVKANQEFKYSATWTQIELSTLTGSTVRTTYITFASENTIESEFVAADNMPKLKIIDFLKGLFNAFKLVVIPQDDGTLYVDTLDDFYAKGTLWNVDKYIDTRKHNVERGTLLNEINFNFEDPTTILNSQFKKNNGIAYGDEETLLNDENGNLLDGDSLDIDLPFETIVYDRLRDINTDELTRIMYAPVIDEDLKPAAPKAHIFFNNPQFLSKPIKFINDNNVVSREDGLINTASHVNNFFGMEESFLFGAEFNEWDGRLIENTLYKNYHQNYIESIFNIRRRNYGFSAVLPLFISTKLKLNDVLKIKGDYYRIDSYNTNIIKGDTTLKLINSFDNDLSKLIVGQTEYEESPEIVIITISTTAKSTTTTKIDIGYGVGWASVSESNGVVTVTLQENNSGDKRTLYLGIDDDDKLKKARQVSISQFSKPVTADNTTITADSTIITADNG